jgi:dUTP pyrophosphatase
MEIRGFKHVSDKQWTNDFERPALPRRATEGSAGYDIFTPVSFSLAPGEAITISTGFKVYMRMGEMLAIFARSGLGFKYYCRPANGTGVIDSDYYDNPKNEGHVFVKLRNDGLISMSVEAGEAVAQGVFLPVLFADDDNPGGKREGGLGSTTPVKQ